MQKRTWESMCWTSLYFINLIIRTKKLAQNCFLNMMRRDTMNSHQEILQKYFLHRNGTSIKIQFIHFWSAIPVHWSQSSPMIMALQ